MRAWFGGLGAAAFVACSSTNAVDATSTTSGSGGQASSNGGSTQSITSTAMASTALSTSSAGGGSTSTASTSSAGGGAPSNRGFPDASPWVSFYGGADGIDLAKTATTFRIINVDADPDTGNFTDGDIQTLRAGGKNRVISYLNVGSCENFRSYWQTDPPGHKSCVSSGALTTSYEGYPDEKWADLSNAAYQDLIVHYVAPRLAAHGVDGFFLDNMEVVEHGANASDGPCNAACAQGGLDLVWQLRQALPDMLIVMQNASSDVTRLGTTHGVAYPSILDGVSHEEVYSDDPDPGSLMEMLAWKKMALVVNGRPFWLASEDYVGSCSAGAKASANAIYAEAQSDGLSEYVTDASAMQSAPCFWSDF